MADFKSGDVIWVKCGQLFWPAQVQDFESLPDDVKEDLDEAKLPKVIAKFFDEDGYEFLFDTKNVFDYNCQKKEEFIKKGIVRSRQKSKEGAKGGWYAKFPEDVVKCEKITGGDVNILEKDPFVERTEPRINYKELFGTPGSDSKKGKGKKGQQKAAETLPPAAGNRKRKAASSAAAASSPKKRAGQSSNPRPIVHPRFRAGGSGSDHQVKILPQPSAPYHLDLQMKQEKTVPSNAYTCHVCGFSATRLNVIVLHQKSHSEPPSANQKKPISKARNSSATSSASSRSTKKSVTSNGSASASRSRKALAKKSTETLQKEQNQEATPKKQKAGPPATSSASTVEKKTATKVVASASSPTPSGKKKRLTKKQKIEQEKKKEERASIMDEWGDDEEDETEEKKKINESMGKTSDMSDNSDGEGYLGDDNLHGFDDDDEEMPKPEEKVEDEVDDKKDGENKEDNKNNEASPKNSDEDQNNDEKQNDLVDDIGKILEETKVPDLPPVESLPSEKKSKRGVKFSEQLDRELKQKKMALVEHSSNLEIPDEVEDEFAESTNEESTARPILKKPVNDLPAANPPSDDELQKARQEEEQKSKDETVSSLLALGNAEVVKGTALEAQPGKVAPAGNTATGSVVANPQPQAVANSGAEGEQEETYILLVDEGSSQMVDSLNSQVLYLDSNSLANGNVVLMTGNDGGVSNAATMAESNGTASSDQVVNKDDVPSTKDMAATASVSEKVSVVTEPVVAEAPAAP